MVTRLEQSSSSPTSFIVRLMWSSWCPFKINIFTWKTLLGRLPTRCNSQLRGIRVQDSTCPFCSQNQKHTTHVLLACRFSATLWALIFTWWDGSFLPTPLMSQFLSQSPPTVISHETHKCRMSQLEPLVSISGWRAIVWFSIVRHQKC